VWWLRIPVKLLPEDLRSELKKPLGKLLRGNENTVNFLLKQMVEKEKPSTIIAVGDKVSSTLTFLGIKVKLYIYDEKTKRTKTEKLRLKVKKIFTVKNPAGTLTDEALKAIKEALKFEGSVAIKVEGEEDLLTLPAIIYAPIGAVVVYGQPDEGVVWVKITNERKKFAENIIERMDVVG